MRSGHARALVTLLTLLLLGLTLSGCGGSDAAPSTQSVPPTITTQPASQTVSVGQTATFTVTAAGTAPLRYQWQKNGTVIGGATAASYTTPATTAADNGDQFTVVVSNAVGSVTSNAASLTVTTTGIAPITTSFPVRQALHDGPAMTCTPSAAYIAHLLHHMRTQATAS